MLELLLIWFLFKEKYPFAIATGVLYFIVWTLGIVYIWL